MQEKVFEAALKLKELAAEVNALKIKGRKLQLPDDLKLRVCRLRTSGVSFATIRRATEIQSSTIRGWAEKFALPQQDRKFRVLKVVSDRSGLIENAEASPTIADKSSPKVAPLVFRYGHGHATLEISPEQLTPELMKILALC